MQDSIGGAHSRRLASFVSREGKDRAAIPVISGAPRSDAVLGALLAEFSEWFGGLWHGRALAATIAVIAIVLAAACFVASAVVRSSASEACDQRSGGNEGAPAPSSGTSATA
jgi:hypothetical protein